MDEWITYHEMEHLLVKKNTYSLRRFSFLIKLVTVDDDHFIPSELDVMTDTTTSDTTYFFIFFFHIKHYK